MFRTHLIWFFIREIKVLRFWDILLFLPVAYNVDFIANRMYFVKLTIFSEQVDDLFSVVDVIRVIKVYMRSIQVQNSRRNFASNRYMVHPLVILVIV